MNLENLITELQEHGVKAEHIMTVKNGVLCKGLKIMEHGNDQICTVVYYSEKETASEIARRVYAAMADKAPDINPKQIMDLEYVKKHVYIGIQRQSKEDSLVRKPFLNLELILRIYVDLHDGTERGSIKVSHNMLQTIGISEDEIWSVAEMNCQKKNLYYIRSMSEIIGIMGGNTGLYVATSDYLADGASVICRGDLLQQFCEDKGFDSCYLLPSSTMEMILLPCNYADGAGNPADLAAMVHEINLQEVDPVIRLAECCYKYNSKENTVEIVAQYRE